MKLGIVTVRGADYHPNRRLLEAAAARGHRAELVHPYRSWPAVTDGRLTVRGRALSFDLLLPRQGAEIGDSSLNLLEQAELAGIFVVNGTAALRLAAGKYRTCRTLTRAGLPVPDSVLVNTPEAAPEAGAAVGGFPAVVKPASGRQGEGVVLAPDAAALARHLEAAVDLARGVLVQRFIPSEGRKDLRVLVTGSAVAGAAVMEPKAGDFRANFHLTGAAGPYEPDATIESLAVSAVRALGLEIAGVDVVIDRQGRPWVLEVNYAPGFRGLEAATGRDIAGAMVAYLEEILGARP